MPDNQLVLTHYSGWNSTLNGDSFLPEYIVRIRSISVTDPCMMDTCQSYTLGAQFTE